MKFVRIGLWRSGKPFCKNAPIVGAVSHALPTAPPPLPPSASSKAGRPWLPKEGRGRSGELKGVSRIGFRVVSSPTSHCSVGEGRGPTRSWLLGSSVTRLLLPSWGLG